MNQDIGQGAQEQLYNVKETEMSTSRRLDNGGHISRNFSTQNTTSQKNEK